MAHNYTSWRGKQNFVCYKTNQKNNQCCILLFILCDKSYSFLANGSFLLYLLKYSHTSGSKMRLEANFMHMYIYVWLNNEDTFCLYNFIKILSSFLISVLVSGWNWWMNLPSAFLKKHSLYMQATTGGGLWKVWKCSGQFW